MHKATTYLCRLACRAVAVAQAVLIRGCSTPVDSEKRQWYRRANLRGSPQKLGITLRIIETCIHR